MVFFASFASFQDTKLIITQPKDKMIVRNTRLNISGTVKGAKAVTINNLKVIPESDGSFTAAAMLHAGKNLVQISAMGADGKKTSFKSRIVRIMVFSDIDDFAKGKPHWAKKDITELSTLGVIEGYPDDTFLPENPITRGEFATWLTRARGIKIKKPLKDVFYDVPKEHWRAPFIKALVDAHLMTGLSSDNFGIDKPIKRSDAVSILVNAYHMKTSGAPKGQLFPDVKKNSKYFRAIEAAYDNGLVIGYPGNSKLFAPDKDMKRSEAVILLSSLPNIKTRDIKLYDFASGFTAAQFARIGTKPQINSLFVSPDPYTPDGITPITVSAEVKDAQGKADISQVWADISSVLGPANSAMTTTEADGIYTLVFVPTTEISSGDKGIEVRALDKEGLENMRSTKISVKGPVK
jgi:S-layer homology domain/Glucodextranase, domain B